MANYFLIISVIFGVLLNDPVMSVNSAYIDYCHAFSSSFYLGLGFHWLYQSSR